MCQHAPFLPLNQVMSTWTSQHALSTLSMPALLSLSHAVHLVIMSAQPFDVCVAAIWWYSAVRQLVRHPRSTFFVIVAIHGLCTFCQCSQHLPPDLLSPSDTLLAISTFRTLRPVVLQLFSSLTDDQHSFSLTITVLSDSTPNPLTERQLTTSILVTRPLIVLLDTPAFPFLLLPFPYYLGRHYVIPQALLMDLFPFFTFSNLP